MKQLSSDSESDEEESRKIREAAVDVKQVLQTKTEATEIESSKSNNITKPSLRPKENFGNEDDNDLHTTPEFRVYVGKKLVEMIDREILTENIWKRSIEEQQNGEESYFRLFEESDPKSSYNHDPQSESHARIKQKRPITSSSSSDSDSEDERLASVVVSTATVLSTSAIHKEKTFGSSPNPGRMDGKSEKPNSERKNCICNKSDDINSEAQSCKNCSTVASDSMQIVKKNKRKNKKKRQKERDKDRIGDCKINSDKLVTNSNKTDTSEIAKKKLKHKHKKKSSVV